MLFGIAGLMPDMVRAVPVWIDDPLIQRVLYANVLEHGAANSDTLPPQFASAASTYFVDEGSLLQQEAAGMLEAYPSEGGPAVSPKVQWGQAPGPDVQNGGSSKTLFGIAGWQAKLAERVRNNVYQSRSQVRRRRRGGRARGGGRDGDWVEGGEGGKECPSRCWTCLASLHRTLYAQKGQSSSGGDIKLYGPLQVTPCSDACTNRLMWHT